MKPARAEKIENKLLESYKAGRLRGKVDLSNMILMIQAESKSESSASVSVRLVHRVSLCRCIQTNSLYRDGHVAAWPIIMH